MTSAVDTPAAAAPTVAVAPAAATMPPAEGSPPKLFGAPRETVALPKAGALDWHTGFEIGLAAGAMASTIRSGKMVEERVVRGGREEPRAGEVEGYVHLDVPVRMRTMSRGSAFCVACEYLVIRG